MYKIGLSSCAYALTEENFKALNKSKIDFMEVSLHPMLYESINFEELKTFSQRYDVGLWSFHLPFAPFSKYDLCTPNKAIRDNAINFCTELIKKASDIGFDKFVAHPGSEPIEVDERNERIEYSMQSLDMLAEIAHKCGSVIAVEDLPRSCIGNTGAELERIISANSKLRVCFDTNHLLYEDNIDFMRRFADKIITVHISDYDFINERHWLPGEGKVDWNKMLEVFKEIGYNGAWMYEIGLETPDTLTRDRDLVFDDFYDNAKSIFAGKKPTLLGVPKENLEA